MGIQVLVPTPVGVTVDMRFKMSQKTSWMQVLVYGHSAFPGNLANLAFSAQGVRNTHKPQHG